MTSLRCLVIPPTPFAPTNPIAADLDQLRPDTHRDAGARSAAQRGTRLIPTLPLFEVGPGFTLAASEAPELDCGWQLRAGATPRNWLSPPRPIDAMDAKGDLWAAMTAVGIPLDALVLMQDAPAFYHPGRSATLRQGSKTVLGSFGELHPRVLKALDLTGPVAAFHLNLDAVAEPKRRRKAAPDLAPFQPIRRDFAFLADSDVTATR